MKKEQIIIYGSLIILFGIVGWLLYKNISTHENYLVQNNIFPCPDINEQSWYDNVNNLVLNTYPELSLTATADNFLKIIIGYYIYIGNPSANNPCSLSNATLPQTFYISPQNIINISKKSGIPFTQYGMNGYVFDYLIDFTPYGNNSDYLFNHAEKELSKWIVKNKGQGPKVTPFYYLDDGGTETTVLVNWKVQGKDGSLLSDSNGNSGGSFTYNSSIPVPYYCGNDSTSCPLDSSCGGYDVIMQNITALFNIPYPTINGFDIGKGYSITGNWCAGPFGYSCYDINSNSQC